MKLAICIAVFLNVLLFVGCTSANESRTTNNCEIKRFEDLDSNQQKRFFEQEFGVISGGLEIQTDTIGLNNANELINKYSTLLSKNVIKETEEFGLISIPLYQLLHRDACRECAHNTPDEIQKIHPSYRIEVDVLRKILDGDENKSINTIVAYPARHQNGSYALVLVGGEYAKQPSGNSDGKMRPIFSDGTPAILQYNRPCPPPIGCQEIK